jgi:hypothetical protein
VKWVLVVVGLVAVGCAGAHAIRGSERFGSSPPAPAVQCEMALQQAYLSATLPSAVPKESVTEGRLVPLFRAQGEKAFRSFPLRAFGWTTERLGPEDSMLCVADESVGQAERQAWRAVVVKWPNIIAAKTFGETNEVNRELVVEWLAKGDPTITRLGSPSRFTWAGATLLVVSKMRDDAGSPGRGPVLEYFEVEKNARSLFGKTRQLKLPARTRVAAVAYDGSRVSAAYGPREYNVETGRSSAYVLKSWDAATGASVSKKPVTGVEQGPVLSADGLTAAFLGQSGRLSVVRLDGGQSKTHAVLVPGMPSELVASARGETVAIVTSCRVLVFRTGSGSLSTLEPPPDRSDPRACSGGRVVFAEFLDEGRLAFVEAAGTAAKLHVISVDGEWSPWVSVPPGSAYAISADGQWLAVAPLDLSPEYGPSPRGTVELWDLSRNRLAALFDWGIGRDPRLAVSPDHGRIVIQDGTRAKSLRLHDTGGRLVDANH